MEGQLFQSGSTQRIDVTCSVDNHSLIVTDGEEQLIFRREEITVQSKLGSLPREITLGDGRLLVIPSSSSLDAWLDGNKGGLLSLLENNRRVLWVSLIATPLLLYLVFGKLIPATAVHFAAYVPMSVKVVASEQTLSALDYSMLSPSELPEDTRVLIRQGFDQVLSDIHTEHEKFTVLFRHSDSMGPNAFALPDGTIVFTDQLVELVDNKQTLLDAILLHEVGHVEHNHSMQLVAESLFATLGISVFFGDISGAVEAFFGVGSSVIHNKFSQAHEWEADNFALTKLQETHRDPIAFAQAMEKLAKLMADGGGSEISWFQSHPLIQQRIDNAKGYGNSDESDDEQQQP